MNIKDPEKSIKWTESNYKHTTGASSALGAAFSGLLSLASCLITGLGGGAISACTQLQFICYIQGCPSKRKGAVLRPLAKVISSQLQQLPFRIITISFSMTLEQSQALTLLNNQNLYAKHLILEVYNHLYGRRLADYLSLGLLNRGCSCWLTSSSIGLLGLRQISLNHWSLHCMNHSQSVDRLALGNKSAL